MIRRVDHKGTLFYRDRFKDLATLLGALTARLILSFSAPPEVRNIFARFQINELTTPYTITAKGSQPERKELVIRG